MSWKETAMQARGMGIHLTLDLAQCSAERLKDLSVIFNLLAALPEMLGMTKITPPYVFRYGGNTAQNPGITGFVVIAESHISIHTYPEHEFAFVDVFSCKDFDCDRASAYIADQLGAINVTTQIVVRGADFPA